eukprot:TRINITY_DN31309_c0_g1_i1.p1 TRINITY_DN31309_c0_g1~~TRINITY_DN31309_c0_g1_i1.p1  ORF type:complete len:386 (+),score=154.33 TRINITY_DN31309_c0_g1_i1:65-1159(+)
MSDENDLEKRLERLKAGPGGEPPVDLATRVARLQGRQSAEIPSDEQLHAKFAKLTGAPPVCAGPAQAKPAPKPGEMLTEEDEIAAVLQQTRDVVSLERAHDEQTDTELAGKLQRLGVRPTAPVSGGQKRAAAPANALTEEDEVAGLLQATRDAVTIERRVEADERADLEGRLRRLQGNADPAPAPPAPQPVQQAPAGLSRVLSLSFDEALVAYPRFAAALQQEPPRLQAGLKQFWSTDPPPAVRTFLQKFEAEGCFGSAEDAAIAGVLREAADADDDASSEAEEEKEEGGAERLQHVDPAALPPGLLSREDAALVAAVAGHFTKGSSAPPFASSASPDGDPDHVSDAKIDAAIAEALAAPDEDD